MMLKWIFDRVVSLLGLLVLCPVLMVVAILVKVKMPGGPALFVQKRVGRNGKLFDCHKFRTMIVAPEPPKGEAPEPPKGEREAPETPKGERKAPEPPKGERKDSGWSSVSVAGDSRITPFGATLRHYKLDELPGLWDVLRGKMSFVGPRPDVPGYADKLEGDDREVLKLRPGITGPGTLKYRLEDEMIAEYVSKMKNEELRVKNGIPAGLSDQELAVWYNDNVIYPDKVRINRYYLHHYSFIKDMQMILCTVLGKKMKYAGEVI